MSNNIISRLIGRFLGPVNPKHLNSQDSSQLFYTLVEKTKFKITFILGFRNLGGLKKNISYYLYHKFCIFICKRRGDSRINYVSKNKYADAFKLNGFFLKNPTPNVIDALDLLNGKISTEMCAPSNNTSSFKFVYNYYFKNEEFDTLRALITDEITEIVRSIYQCNFLVHNAYLERQFTTKDIPKRSSWLWHFDDIADCQIKIFYFVTDVDKDRGATRLHNLDNSKEMMKLGFLDRYKISNNVESILTDENKIYYAEGERGTVFMFDPKVMHKSVNPERSYRDIIVLEVFPSPYEELKYLPDNNVDTWKSPLNLLFSKHQ